MLSLIKGGRKTGSYVFSGSVLVLPLPFIQTAHYPQIEPESEKAP